MSADFWNDIIAHHAAATTPGELDSYRGWSIGWEYGRFQAFGPNYEASWEGEEDGWVASGGSVEARTREDLIAEIDAWIDEHPEDQK